LIHVNPDGAASDMIASFREGAMTDFCYSRPMLKRVLEQAELMDRMMDALGINPATAARIDRGSAWYEARSRCIACTRDTGCRRWLSGLQGEISSSPPAFCANADFFRLARQSTDKRPAQAKS
jgi:hypothetical protein